ncbi:hypothetical protein PC119_g5012 [Phytophthora cactorum]|uniref:Uncharacterized protein n=1 Tax=Phytophthora cactorum TaxID=29920 RepID=A0A8T0ZLG7_9STRA|nr:hypothetical protein PC113_g5271 [Phytophthora cactorum]KAG3034116.1 hypothetical protein PC119_g5012 [Phytophthora cactorum]KAG3067790.1 hypothetical protein PC121_g10388 [Phytophthora cactorum]
MVRFSDVLSPKAAIVSSGGKGDHSRHVRECGHQGTASRMFGFSGVLSTKLALVLLVVRLAVVAEEVATAATFGNVAAQAISAGQNAR